MKKSRPLPLGSSRDFFKAETEVISGPRVPSPGMQEIPWIVAWRSARDGVTADTLTRKTASQHSHIRSNLELDLPVSRTLPSLYMGVWRP